MILSNTAYAQLKRQSKSKRTNLNTEEIPDQRKMPDWLLFTNLNAHEVPYSFVELEE